MDLIEAKRNLESLHQDKEKLESLNHLNSTFQFKQACQHRIHDIDKQINNIQHNIKRYARPQMYSDRAIKDRLQQELVMAVKTVQDEMKINFTHVNVELDIYGDQSKVAFAVLHEEYSRPNA